MHDIRLIRTDPAVVRRGDGAAGLPPQSPVLLEKDGARRAAQTAAQEKQTRRNALSQAGGGRDGARAKTPRRWKPRPLPCAPRRKRWRSPRLIWKWRFATSSRACPNVLDADVPDGADETANVVLKTWGEPRDPGFQPKQHYELGEALGMMDFATAAKISPAAASRCCAAPLARLERALGQFMIDLHTREHGYEETIVPLLVNDAAVFGTDNLPKFADDLFRTTDGRWLIPTAECAADQHRGRRNHSGETPADPYHRAERLLS